ncbi:hypothetical protein [Gordonia sp. (in: high G+C Gram-positive bacteria)]|uniref:hypothetical protein n=1 Tax=Gordonia sp. (in: high G+C Gram-positive bacteria) TaxID=84139 RepID=UPI003342D813
MPTTAERGYGSAHKRLRQTWAPTVEAGGVACARCSRPISPYEPWDLGHDDHDRSVYTGPEHRRCNRGAPSRRRAGQRAIKPDKQPTGAARAPHPTRTW